MAASMALSQASASLSLSARHNVCAFSSPKFTSYCPFPRSNAFNRSTSFTSGSPLLIQKSFARQPTCKAMPVSIRSEQRTQGESGLDVWLGRAAMVGFAVAITVEITTGKGLLENFGLTSPLPTVALAVTALVGVLTAIFIFQSASKS